MNEVKNTPHLSSSARISSYILGIFAPILIFFAFGLLCVPHQARAQAFVPVFDSQNFIENSITAANTTSLTQKELVSDGVFYMAARLVIQNITDSIVRWINSGFKGSPAFITNPDEFFTDVADQVAGNYIAGTELDFLCSPFQLEIRAALNFNYSSKHKIVCRLTDAIKNVQDFAKFTSGDFSQGGWDGWFSMTQNPGNNPYGAYTAAQGELSLRITTAQGRELSVAGWGNGFLSWKDDNGNIQTPGSVINNQLEQVLGSGVRQLELADEFNEIVGALMGQFVQQVLIGGLSNAQSVKDHTYDNTLSGSCSSDRSTARVGESVTWSAYRYESGTNNYRYAWQGDGPLAGQTGNRVTVQYATSSVYAGRVNITGGSGLTVVNCSNTVTITP